MTEHDESVFVRVGIRPLISALGGEQNIDALDCLGGDRCFAEPREIEELASRVCLARSLNDGASLRLAS